MGVGEKSDCVSLGVRGAQMQATKLYSHKSVVKAAVCVTESFVL